MDAKSKFPQRLKVLREQMGYTPKEFAVLLDIKQQTYYVYEKGRALPTIDTLIHIAETCNVSLDWLCGKSEEQITTSQKKEVSHVLSQLLKENKNGNKIEIKIVCQNQNDFV